MAALGGDPAAPIQIGRTLAQLRFCRTAVDGNRRRCDVGRGSSGGARDESRGRVRAFVSIVRLSSS